MTMPSDTPKPNDSLTEAIRMLDQAMPGAGDEEIARELKAKFPEVISDNRDALMIAGLDSMINEAKKKNSRNS